MFGFLDKIKEKIVKVKLPKQQQLENIKDMLTSMQSGTKSFDSVQVSKRLSLINENCNKWEIYIINESSTGLFFCDSHNRKCIEAKVRAGNEATKRIKKRRLLLEQIQKTQKEIEEVSSLSSSWCTNLSSRLQQLQAP